MLFEWLLYITSIMTVKTCGPLITRETRLVISGHPVMMVRIVMLLTSVLILVISVKVWGSKCGRLQANRCIPPILRRLQARRLPKQWVERVGVTQNTVSLTTLLITGE